MKISFFEEFPDADNLSKLSLLDFPTKLYVAASSCKDFKRIALKIKNKNVKEIVYWPILTRKEGYWVSPFSERKALLRVFEELKSKKLPIMLDLELPTTQNFWLYLKSYNFFKNKKLIREFIDEYKGNVYLAEYYPEGELKEKILFCLGLHYNKVKVIKMMYHSLHSFSENLLRKKLKKGLQKYGDNYLVGLGTISVGVHGNDPILSADQLRKDLQLAEEVGVSEVVIFRLGGLNKEYLKVLKKCQTD
tara:strand:- start:331 stop:1074 length:744 start_codon:yes stop_codon:yes gene_type:complete